jgi:hypothetical protein
MVRDSTFLPCDSFTGCMVLMHQSMMMYTRACGAYCSSCNPAEQPGHPFDKHFFSL